MIFPVPVPPQINSIPTPEMAWKKGGFTDGIMLENSAGLIQLETGGGFIQLET